MFQDYPLKPIIQKRTANSPLPNGHCRWCGGILPSKDSFKDKRFYSEYYCPQPSKCRKLWGSWFYRNYTWGGVRQRVMNRDSYACVICGEYAEEVDHIKAISLGGLPFQLENLRSMCKKHHRRKTRDDLTKLNLKTKNVQYIPLLEYF